MGDGAAGLVCIGGSVTGSCLKFVKLTRAGWTQAALIKAQFAAVGLDKQPGCGDNVRLFHFMVRLLAHLAPCMESRCSTHPDGSLEFIDYHAADGLARITLRRPPHHVLHIALLDELARVLEIAAADTTLRLLCLTAAEGRCFSAGVDVADHTAERVRAMLAGFHRVILRLHDFPVPTLAVLQGAALGGGLELALACDLRVAAAGVRLAQPEIRLGVFAPAAAVLLPRLLPLARAHELLFSGDELTAEEGLALGLINRVWSDDDVAARLEDYIQPYLRLSAVAQRHNKRALRLARTVCGDDFAAALARLERLYLDELMASADANEGLASFLEKRPPQWKHR